MAFILRICELSMFMGIVKIIWPLFDEHPLQFCAVLGLAILLNAIGFAEGRLKGGYV